MSRQIQERDRTAVPFGDLDRGQILRDRVRERDFTLSDHVSEQECGENFGHRANLKTGVAIQRSRVSLAAMAVRDDATALGSDHAYHDADAIFLPCDGGYPFGEPLANISV